MPVLARTQGTAAVQKPPTEPSLILHCSIPAVNPAVAAIAHCHCPADAKTRRRRSAIAPYNIGMYIIAIGWLYVTVLMALTETSVVAGILSLTFYGLLPTALLLWLFGGPTRRRRAARMPSEPGEADSSENDQHPGR